MIFTGVTGGEIVSLLYPLFILSPFCYIIISKESLDGFAYFLHRSWRIPDLSARDRFLHRGRSGGNHIPWSVCSDDRSDGFGSAGVSDVSVQNRSGYDGQTL